MSDKFCVLVMAAVMAAVVLVWVEDRDANRWAAAHHCTVTGFVAEHFVKVNGRLELVPMQRIFTCDGGLVVYR